MNTQKHFTQGATPRHYLLHLLKYFYSKNFYYGSMVALATGLTSEGRGCSSSDWATFGSVGGRVTPASDLGSMSSAGWATSSWCMLAAMSARRASITHYTETCLATNFACGSKLSPSEWMSSTLQPSAYSL